MEGDGEGRRGVQKGRGKGMRSEGEGRKGMKKEREGKGSVPHLPDQVYAYATTFVTSSSPFP